MDRQPDHVRWIDWCVAIVLGCALAAVIWQPLLAGGGLVGGDTYPYFYPQKQVLAEAFEAGRVPLWHPRTALGYPLHAESQGGVFYPTNQILYRLFDVNQAYSYNVVLHYAVAFVMSWRLARSQNISQLAAFFAAAVFVYGWFPARLSLEWSIIGAVWFPTCLWLTVRWLERRSIPRLIMLAVAFAIHLLAGHFTLAFITELTCIGYACLWSIAKHLEVRRQESGRVDTECDPVPKIETPQRLTFRLFAAGGPVLVAVMLSVGFAAIQVVPTLELRQVSQRQGQNKAFNPAYGHLPPVYMTQVVASWWYWHTPEMVQTRAMMKYPFLSVDADSNQVEAHLYFGLIPFGLLLTLVVNGNVRKRIPSGTVFCWSILGLSGLLYATGWLVPLFKYLPGFGFFMGPARYTIITTMGAALLTGSVLDVLWRRQSPMSRFVIWVAITGLTVPDLLKSSEFPVRDALVVEQPPFKGLEISWLRDELHTAGLDSVRLLAPGPNVANLYGVSSIPQYLGLGPSEYYDDEQRYRRSPPDTDDVFPTEDELKLLIERGVTHILTTSQIRTPATGIELVASGPDAFLNAVWSRGNDSCYLYRLKTATGRTSADDPAAVEKFEWLMVSAELIEFQIQLKSPTVVHLRELMYPGWKVSVDQVTAKAVSDRGFSRSVALESGSHVVRWSYEPASFTIGVLITLATSLLSVSVCCWRVIRTRKSLTAEEKK